MKSNVFTHTSDYQSPQITGFRYYLISAGCGYLSICLSGHRCNFDCSHTIQPTALKLWHNIPHVNILNGCSQIFDLLPFSIFLYDFSVTLKSNYAKTNGDRNEFFFAYKLTGRRQNFIGKIYAPKCPDFLLCLFVF